MFSFSWGKDLYSFHCFEFALHYWIYILFIYILCMCVLCVVLWGLNLCQHLYGNFARSHLTPFQRDPHTGNVLFSRERQFRLLEQCLHPEPFTQGDRIIYCLVVHPVFSFSWGKDLYLFHCFEFALHYWIYILFIYILCICVCVV